MTVQDLRPNSQDTSVFYLGNIYEVLADPNVARASPVAKPPPFSRPRYAIWENSFLFLSLVISLSCALLATSLQQWARRYIRLTQLSRTSPERRAQTRAFYAEGVEKMHIPLAVEGLPTLLHLSLFLFFAGLAVFLYNVDVEVFTCVVCSIGLFLVVYVLITLLPLIRSDSPYYTPLSKPLWFLKASILFVNVSVFCFIAHVSAFIHQRRSTILYFRTVRWLFRGMEKEGEESAAKQSLDIVRILGWTTRALGDDSSRGKFFDALPGLFKSKLVKNFEKVPQTLLSEFWETVDTFIIHTTTSNSVSKEVESRLVDIGKDIASMIPCPRRSYVERIPKPEPVSIDRVELMVRWIDHEFPLVSCAARFRAAEMLGRMEKRDNRWYELAHELSGLSEPDLRSDIDMARNSMLLAIAMDTYRRQIFHFPNYEVYVDMRQLINNYDMDRTLPRLQHEFCQVWNDLVQEARKPESRDLASYRIPREICGRYISLHPSQGPDSLSSFNDEYNPSKYPLCDIPSHHPDSAAPLSTHSGHSLDAPPPSHRSVSSGRTTPWLYSVPITARPFSSTRPTISIRVQDNFSALPRLPTTDSESALQVHISSHPSDAVQPISLPTVLSYTPEGTTQRDTVLEADAASASASDIFFASSVAGFLIPTIHSPPHVPPFPDAEYPAFSSGTKYSHPTDNTTLPRSRACGLVNSGSMCLFKAVLQLLVHFPPFWDVLRVLGDLKGQLGAGGPETATPLVDATMRFFEEFMSKEKKPPPSQQPPQQAVREITREHEEEKIERNAVDSIEPTYIYDAMKEKTQLKDLLVRSRDQDAPFYH